VIVDCAIYRSGVRETVTGDISNALDEARERGDDCFLWIGLHEPTTEEFDLVRDELKLHPLAVEDAVVAHQRPKLQHYGDSLFVVLKTVMYDEATSSIDLGDVMLFVGHDWLITVRHGEAGPLKPVRQRLESDPELLAGGPSAVLYAIMDEIVDIYGAIAHAVEADIIELERRVFSADTRDVTEDIYELKREVIEFRVAEDPLIPVLEDIVRHKVAACHKTAEYFRDVLDHLLRVDQTVDAANELLTSILNAHLTLVAAQQNEDMRKISAWAAILVIPTMITGLYGMNFTHMPELRWTYGYGFALVLILGLCGVAYWWFKKHRWL
jgi:magnesium transporter